MCYRGMNGFRMVSNRPELEMKRYEKEYDLCQLRGRSSAKSLHGPGAQSLTK